jgi:hypothetical protein
MRDTVVILTSASLATSYIVGGLLGVVIIARESEIGLLKVFSFYRNWEIVSTFNSAKAGPSV